MMVRVILAALLVAPLLSFSASALGVSAVRDSVGVERKNGKLFVQHKVEPKETLYALSRKYNVSVSQIVEANPNVETTINIGQIVLIPRRGAATVASAASKASASSAAAATTNKAVPAASNRTYTVNENREKIHVVEPKQTLYAISRMYGVSVETVRRWNNLPSNQISIGDSLVVGKNAAAPTKQPVYVPEPDDEITVSKPADSATTNTSPATVSASPQPATAPAVEREREEVEDASGIKKIFESGMAEAIDPKADTDKYLALHRSAPVGTIMQVKNAMNGQIVYVRVVGKLPDTGANDKVVVRLSKKACDKLGAVDSKFRVELSYMP
ncbi:LysM peptidoglycan-binding domain-containing protein [Pontibacter silvestris]|uniref:LysM peptidoglycan-binding domain-containing protein n=1 Tax=Pontibacter silvestris TaxID=2305183 RepID=A0ABW4WV09_9BACT|nr:LysM peptidoglycan-binding domain-containing protein [Pontibacter silvestris]MCC9138367.1 LysM peptidoglycan-binding domain-containing protein [Pontibacter silvestris]